MSNANPSLNPADNGTLAGSINFAFKKMMQNTNGMLPAQVIAYDRTTNRVQVQILITILTTDGTQVPRPQLASIPVLVLGGGGFIVSMPLQAGNLGWVIASDRDISSFLQNYNQAPPNTDRLKNFADSLFIPDAMTGYTIGGDDTDNLVLQNLDGTVVVSIGADTISLTAPTININAGTAANMTINAGAGTFEVTGNIHASGTITP